MKKILIIGATSIIAQETARLYCKQVVEFYLVSRNPKNLQIVSEDLLARGAKKVTCLPTDPVAVNDSNNIINNARKCLQKIDIAIIAHGNIPDQDMCKASPKRTARSLMINSLSVISLATSIANLFEKQHKGCLVVLSSMAGDRCHEGNYVNAATKASVDTFMEGLRHRFRYMTSIEVITIKPAFVDTPLTEHFKKNLLWSTPESIAKGIKRAIELRQSHVVYLPWFWQWNWVLGKLLPSSLTQHLPY